VLDPELDPEVKPELDPWLEELTWLELVNPWLLEKLA